MNNIQISCTNNDIESFKLEYQNANENIFFLDQKGNTILHNLIKNNQYDIVKFLLEKKLDFNIENDESFAPIDLAITMENFDIMALFIEHYSSSFLSSVINSKPINEKMKEFILSFIEYDSSIYLPDFDLYYLSEKNSSDVSDEMFQVLKNFILREKWDDVKNIIVNIYKTQNTKLFYEVIPILIIYSEIKENKELLEFALDIFDIKIKNNDDIIFKDEILIDLFKYGTNKSISTVLNMFGKNQPAIKKEGRFFVRGSLDILKTWAEKYNANFDINFVKEIFLFNPNVDYMEYLKFKSGLNNYDINEIIISLIFENDPLLNEKIIDFLNNNKVYTYITNINNENLLNRIIKSDNYTLILYLLDNFSYLVNNYNMNEKYALFESMKYSNIDIFELIVNHENTDLNVFDENINNILHFYSNNINVIKFPEEKFEIILPYIDDNILLLSNKYGETALVSMAKKSLTDNIKSLAMKNILNEDNANYKVYNTSLLDIVNINIINKSTNINLNHTVDLGSVEKYVFSEDFISLSKLLYLYNSDKNKRKDINNDIVMLSIMNKSSNINIVKMLSFYNVSVDGLNSEEVETPIMKAISSNNIDLCLFLLNNNCEINTELNNQNNLSIAIKNNLDIIVYLLLKEKIEVDLNILNNTDYLKWKNLCEIKEGIISKFNFKKEKYKESFFDKKEVFQYRIDKNDTDIIKMKKIIRNILDSVNNAEDLVALCNSKNIEVEFYFEKNKLSKIYFNKEISNESLGLTLSQIKEKIKYNYFEIKKLKRGKKWM